MYFKKIIFIILVGSIFLSQSFIQTIFAGEEAPKYDWEFNNADDVKQWVPGPNIDSFTVKNGKLYIHSNQDAPYFANPAYVDINADEYSVMEIKMKADSEYEDANVFWAVPFADNFDQQRSIDFVSGKSGRFNTYYINMKKHPAWKGVINRLLIQPSQKPGSVEVDYIKIYKPNFLILLKTWRQEFFSFETIKARTVNFIIGPTINGIRINVYIYLFIFFSFLILALKELFLSKLDFKLFLNNIQAVFLKIIILSLIIWAVLEGRLFLDYFRMASADYHALWGKSLDEKRELTTGGGFYNFLSFCNKKIPERVDVSLFAHEPYPRAKGAYYLYPHNVVENAPYAIIYHKDTTLQGYSLFATFKKDEYILKKEKQ